MAMRWFTPTRFLFLGIACFLLADLFLVGPDISNPDVRTQKDAAIQLVLGRGMTSTYNFGNPSAEPLVFAGYPPGLTLIYAAYGKIVGIGVAANSFFNALSQAMAAGLFFLCLKPVFGFARWGSWFLVGSLLVLMPGGLFLLSGDRPDLLGLAFHFLALWIGPCRSQWASFLASASCGAALLISPICGLLAVLGLATRWFVCSTRSPKTLPRMAALGLAGLLSVIAPVLLVLALSEPDYLQRLWLFMAGEGVDSSTGQTTGLYSLLRMLGGNGDVWWSQFKSTLSTFHGPARLLILGAVLLALLTGVWATGRTMARGQRVFLSGLFLACAVLPVLIIPYNSSYVGIAIAFLLALWSTTAPKEQWFRTAAGRAMAVVLAASLLAQTPFIGQSAISRLNIQSSLDRATSFLDSQYFPDRNGDGEVWIMTSPLVYLLFASRGLNTIGIDHVISGARDAVVKADYFAFSYVGSRDPLQPTYPDWFESERAALELLYRPKLPQVPSIFGFALGNSSKTWEPEFWARR